MSEILKGEIGGWGIPIIHSPHVPPGQAIISADPTFSNPNMMIVMDMTRPTLEFPLYEHYAFVEIEGIPPITPWYFDRTKWPYRKPREFR